MSRDGIDDALDVDEEGLSASEKARKRRIAAIYRWMEACKRRSS